MKKIALKLNTKKTKLITAGRTTSLRIDNEDNKLVDSICHLGSAINSKGRIGQEMHCRLVLCRVVMKTLEKIMP